VAQEFRVAVQNLQFSIFSQVCAVDQLTGVWNRYAMGYKLAQEQERVRRTGKPCSIALIDADSALMNAKLSGRDRVHVWR